MHQVRELFVQSLLLLSLGLTCRLASAQSTSCQLITVDDLGSTTQFSTQGLIAEAIVPITEASGTRVPVRIFNFTIVCDASGARRNTSSFISVVVELRCMSDIAGLTVCDGNTDITRQYQFQCVEDNGQAVWDAIVSGSTTNVQTENPTATLSTPLANQCRRCIDDVQSSRADTTTHCEPCPVIQPACNLGQGRCYLGQAVDMCCNFYLQGNCRAAECPSALEADSNFDCVCPSLSLGNGTVSYSVEMGVERNIGSVATYTCNPGYRLLPQDGTMPTCSMNGWSDQNFTCERVTNPIQCPELGSVESGKVIVTPAVRTVNSTAEYTCDDGYKLDKGDAKRTCQPDGTWSGEVPECSKTGLGTGAIVGIAVGAAAGVIILALIIMIVTVIVVKLSKKKTLPADEKTDQSDMMKMSEKSEQTL